MIKMYKAGSVVECNEDNVQTMLNRGWKRDYQKPLPEIDDTSNDETKEVNEDVQS